MSERTETLTIELPSDLVESVRSAVESGRYESVSHMVWAALDYLGEAVAAEPDVETLRRLVREGLDSGPSLDGDAVFAKLREKYMKAAMAK
jgi:putative addiction module CopG family antidote